MNELESMINRQLDLATKQFNELPLWLKELFD